MDPPDSCKPGADHPAFRLLPLFRLRQPPFSCLPQKTLLFVNLMHQYA
jgi:hypothetical protein